MTSITSSSSSSVRKIRFFELASLIPEHGTPEEGPNALTRSNSSSSSSVKSRPRLCSRAYSLPMPALFGKDAIPEEFREDPAFMPSSPPRLNIRVPSFTRRTRSSSTTATPRRSCLKSASSRSPQSLLDGDSCASSSIGSSTSVYCAPLARISSLPSYNSAGAQRLLDIPPEKLPSDLQPLSECCKRCEKATRYGAENQEYQEHWTPSARSKRERDEATMRERGEGTGKGKSSKCSLLGLCPPAGDGTLSPVPEAVDELEFAKKKDKEMPGSDLSATIDAPYSSSSDDNEMSSNPDDEDEVPTDATSATSDDTLATSLGSLSSGSSFPGRKTVAPHTQAPAVAPTFEGGAPLAKPPSRPSRTKCINPNFASGSAMHKEIFAALQDADLQEKTAQAANPRSAPKASWTSKLFSFGRA